MKREIPLEKIYESHIRPPKLYSGGHADMLWKDRGKAEFEVFLRFNTSTIEMKPFIKGDFYYHELDIKGGSIDSNDTYYENESEKKFLINILHDYFYSSYSLNHFFIERVEHISFDGMTKENKSQFQIRFEGVFGRFDKKAVENKRFLNTIDPSIRDEFGDELLSM